MFLKNITKELRGLSSELKSLNGKLDKLIEVQSNKDNSYEKDLVSAVTKLAEAVEKSTLTAQDQFSKAIDLSRELMEGLMADDINEDFFTEEEANEQKEGEISFTVGSRSAYIDELSKNPGRNLLDLSDETDLRQFAEPLLNDGFVTAPVEDLPDEDVDEEDIDEEEDLEDDELSSEDNPESTHTVSLSTLYYYVDQIPDLVHVIYPDKTGSDFSIFLEALGKVDLSALGDYIERVENNFTSMSDFYEIRHTNIFKDRAQKVTAEMVKSLKSETEVPEAPYAILPVQEAIEDFFLMAVKFLNGILIDRSQAVNAYRLSDEVLRSYVS